MQRWRTKRSRRRQPCKESLAESVPAAPAAWGWAVRRCCSRSRRLAVGWVGRSPDVARWRRAGQLKMRISRTWQLHSRPYWAESRARPSVWDLSVQRYPNRNGSSWNPMIVSNFPQVLGNSVVPIAVFVQLDATVGERRQPGSEGCCDAQGFETKAPRAGRQQGVD